LNDEFQENEGSHNSPHWVLCPQQNNTLKLRRDRQKRIIVSGPPLTVTKCFGMLLAAGRNLRHSDMQLLELESMGPGANPSVYVINAIWDPRVHVFDVLNTETPRDSRVFLTVAADVIIAEAGEPIRFRLEAKARVFHRDERFYKLPRVALREGYSLTLERTDDISNGETSGGGLMFVKMESDTDRISVKQRLGRSPSRMPSQLILPTGDDESDSDEPLLSGSGDVSKDCPEELMKQWTACIEEWRTNEEGARPAIVSSLIHNGVPDVLRGEVWRLLAKDCPSEQVILRDIHRTFPAHENFKEAGGGGQESLYKISKAYSLYDEEVSYCQGLSFLAASLLLHMNEEQAFCTLVKIMYDYQLRDLFKLGFDSLHLRFYQLTRLLKEYESNLAAHLEHIGVETHMYASQWFLTLFTAKFPLQMVFFIVDLFLSELKHKRLLKYEKEYLEMKERERENEDPLVKLQKENARHCETILRLERENDDLAHELVTSKIELRRKLDAVEDQVETSANTIERVTRQNEDLLEENRNLQREYNQIKEMYRKEVSRLEEDANRASKLLKEYKQLFSQMSRSVHYFSRISACDKCWPAVEEWEANRSPARTPQDGPDLLSQLEEREAHVKALEIDLAQTKLALVEAECKNQDLTHQMMTQSESDGKR
uniref:Rab-GAP TBC domain-containing protein n=1 Tax=Angiostrongylus costaricensis TaxID=334426 RepID=A0A0R3PEK7_ANGCS